MRKIRRKMDNNKFHYEQKYLQEIEYKYKTNTRYQRFLVEKIEHSIDNKTDILSLCDIGCGQGLNTFFFLNDFPNAEISGIDLSEHGIEYAKDKWHNPRLKFECANILDYDLSKAQYDVVTAFELLEHIEDWKTVAAAMCNVSKKYIIVSAPIGKMRKYEIKHGHYRNFKKGELELFFQEKGFEVIKTYYAGFPFWSPITRDLLNLLPGDSTSAQSDMGRLNKCISVVLYYMFKYFSCKHIGDQFVGLFKKKDYFTPINT